MDPLTGHFQYVDTHEATEFHDQHETFGFTSSSEDAYSSYQHTNTFHGSYGEQLNNMDSLGAPTLSPNIFSPESYYGSSSHKSSMTPHVVETLLACSTGDATDFCNIFQKTSFLGRNSSHQFTEQHNTAIVQSQPQVLPNTKLLSTLSPANSDSPSSSKYSLHGSMPKARPSEFVKACVYGKEKLTLPSDDLSSSGKSSGLCSFASEHINNFFTNPPDMRHESSLLFRPKYTPPTDLCDQQSDHVIDDAAAQNNESLLGVRSVSPGLVEGDNSGYNMITRASEKQVENSISAAVDSLVLESDKKENSSISPMQLLSNNGLLDSMELDIRSSNFVHELWDNISRPVGHNSSSSTNTSTSGCISVMEMGSISSVDKGLFSESGLQQLLDAIVGDHVNKASTHGSEAIYANPISSLNLENQLSTSLSDPRNQVTSIGLNGASALLMPYCNSEVHGSPKQPMSNSHFSSWIDDSCSMNTDNSVLNQSKKSEEAAKAVKKRARPGESTRPRPKDRQQIQDRLKELREIVPNGAKCSIDALLDKTIKHMLFLQSVTKYADKLKQADEPKMIGEESGVVLKDNTSGVSGGGATWAYEVAGQTMVCPIIVEDLTPPGQMLVEMLCEDRGLFLEIADIIRGFGLVILKGVMEIRECKIWARFLVEANREVTRMDIFLSLIQLLQQNSCLRSSDLATKVLDKGSPVFPGYHQSPIVSSS
ncbi:hypothetical protein Cni_G14425 [Canna indica]|uniref:BHLH domain-containing protein n=1 Tax=Canna indica TaxID=4628 RepID=A0AAQ3KHV6_9LILI|nr:hypothetical protein Cni_G14425 [Canna indica]